MKVALLFALAAELVSTAHAVGAAECQSGFSVSCCALQNMFSSSSTSVSITVNIGMSHPPQDANHKTPTHNIFDCIYLFCVLKSRFVDRI